MKDFQEREEDIFDGNGNANASTRKRTSESGLTQDTNISTPSNEYVLNVAFFSFLIFMMIQGFFAIVARSQSMLSDSLAMSVDAFTYLFNLIAERLKKNPISCLNYHLLTPEERRKKRRLVRLYLEFFPPLISVIALTVVSYQGLRQSIDSIIRLTKSPILGATYISSAAEDEDPNVGLMLFFSGLNLLLDMLNVTCFAKTENFSITSLEGCGLQLENKVPSKEHDYQRIERMEENGHDIELGKGTNEKGALEEKKEEVLKKVYPVATVDSNGSSSNDDDITYSESDKLLGIVRPDYTSPEKEWGEDLSIGAMYGGGDSIKSEDSYGGRNTYFSFVSTGTPGTPVEEETNLVAKTLSPSPSNNGTKVIDWGDGLDGISEGEEEENGEDNDLISEDDVSDEVHNGLFNLNMCSAYTHVMADTLRSIAVFVAAGSAYIFSLNPAIADATASIVVSIVIAISLGPLLLGLAKTIAEIRNLYEGENIIEDDFNDKLFSREQS